MRFGSVFGNNEVSFWQYLLIFNEILLFNEIYFVVLNQEILIPLVCIMQVPLTKRQCFLLICAGSFSHFFLDHLFEVIFFLIFVPFILIWYVPERDHNHFVYCLKMLVWKSFCEICILNRVNSRIETDRSLYIC